ncbi:uncharacterized protein TNCV_366641 [Trichonephila clavipes]|nr:uncharacterized protein TNCV_366641 [Trichonephila clavipes]
MNAIKSPQDFWTPDLTSTYSVCNWRVFGGIGQRTQAFRSARNDRQLLRIAVNGRTASSRQLAARWSTATGVLHQFVDVCCTMDCVQGCLYTGHHSGRTIDRCVYNGLMNTEPLAKLVGTKLSFQGNHTSICGTMMAVFVAMPMNAAFLSALSNDILA